MNKRNKKDSDEELLHLLTKANESMADVRLMRLGGPRRFRASVISMLKNSGGADSKFASLLLSDRIPSIKVLLASMDDAPFLSRLDYEGARSWKIWRVRSQVRQFAMALIEIAKLRHDPNSLIVGFHKEDLIWNIGIVGSEQVLLRAYGSGTGHDASSRSIEFSFSQDPDLVVSFINYFDSIAHKSNTNWLSLRDQPAENPLWPSLYKGNAILANKDDFDGTEEPELADDEVCKICFNPESSEAEMRWLGLSPARRHKLHHFRPGQIRGPLENVRGSGLRIQKIPGPTLFDVMSKLDKLNSRGIVPDEKASKITRILLENSYNALLEFRKIADSVFFPRKPYPYAMKLRAALSEVRPYLPRIDSSTWEASLLDADELGRELEAESKVPFRDAHMKNRLWESNTTREKFVNDFLKMPTDELSENAKINIRDIDFETAIDNVTEWDDLFHLLYFEYSSVAFNGASDRGPLVSVLNEAKQNLLFWRTGLMRALREHCRRLWYENIMPRTFQYRYSKETPGYFLDLARLCSENAGGFLGLGRLLGRLPQGISIKQNDSDGDKPTSHALPSSLCYKPLAPPKHKYAVTKKLRVFISYSRQEKDKEHMDRLQNLMKLLEGEGILELWTDRHIRPGQTWEKEIRSKLAKADIIVFLVSPDLLFSEFIANVELPTAKKRYRKGEAVIVPIIVRPISYENSMFAEFQALPTDARPVEKWPNNDDAWLNIEEEIRTMLKTIQAYSVRAWLTRR